jgi:hypothetical protein
MRVPWFAQACSIRGRTLAGAAQNHRIRVELSRHRRRCLPWQHELTASARRWSSGPCGEHRHAAGVHPFGSGAPLVEAQALALPRGAPS